jgi:hypothetical protein
MGNGITYAAPAARAGVQDAADPSNPNPQVKLKALLGPYRGQTFVIQASEGMFLTTIVLGRTRKFFGNGVSLSKDHEVSTRHALIEVHNGDGPLGGVRYFLRDLHSTNGTGSCTHGVCAYVCVCVLPREYVCRERGRV